MARKITDEDIVEALNGTGTTDHAVVEALHGNSIAARRADNAVLEALGHTPAPVVAEGELPLQERGDDLEALRIWSAQGATEHATKALAEALMRSDPKKGIYAAEAEARKIAAEAYAEAAKSLAYEDSRQEHVQKFVTKMAERVTRPKLQEAKKPASLSEAVPAGLTKKVTTSNRTGLPITYYS